MAEPRIVWSPLPGSQTLAMSCPANIIFYAGSRGPGKTDAQLMRFRSRVGQGYGRHWRGVIFDREYKNLDDLVSKSLRWFPEFDDKARFINSKSDYKWVWKTGEELLFRTVKKDADYWGFHGQEFCNVVGENVITERGNIPVEKLTLNDKVLTPKGFKQITKIFPKVNRFCVQTSFLNKDFDLISQQSTSKEHRLLTSDGHFSQVSSCSFQTVRLLKKTISLDKEVLEFHHDLDRESLVNDEFSTSEGNSSIESDTKLQSVRPFVLLSLILLLFQLHFRKYEKNQPATNLYYGHYKFFEQLYDYKVKLTLIFSGLLRLFEPVLRVPNHLFLNLNALINADAGLQKVQGFLIHYFSYFCPCGELVHKDKETFLSFVQRWLYAKVYSHLSSSDGLVNEFLDTHPCDRKYWHPYKGTQENSNLQFLNAYSFSVPIGFHDTIDITVADENCYFNTSGSLSQNCFIGWNELTKYPSDHLFEAMMSCNRSSFRPEDFPYYINGDLFERKGQRVQVDVKHKHAVKCLLPEIPLEVFATGNPFGPGHHWVRKRFVDAAPMGKIVKKVVNVFNPRTQKREDVEKTQVYIFGSYRENKFLSPEYVASLETIDDPNKRKAWLMGSWDVVSGGMFGDVWDSNVHIVVPFKIPSSWRLDRSFDWGSSKPFSVGWWAESDGTNVVMPDGSVRSTVRGDVFRIAEWYGCTGKPNEGLRMLGSEIAKGIVDREIKMGLYGKVHPGPADNSINDVENGNSIAASMRESIELNSRKYPGINWTRSDKTPGSRVAGWEKMRLYLKNAKMQHPLNEDGLPIKDQLLPREYPGLFIFNNCKDFIEQIPVLPRDEINIDDCDTSAEDHIADEARYKLLSIGVGAKGGRTSGTQ